MYNGNDSYEDRCSIKSTGEVLFEVFCQRKGFKFTKLGFDENADPIRNFSAINPMLRNLPDYIVDTQKELLVVQVKGTQNFKKKEYDMIPLFLEWYSTSKAPLVYAFCKKGHSIKLLFPEKVIELYNQSKDQKWSDGVVYRNLKLFEGEDDGDFSRNN